MKLAIGFDDNINISFSHGVEFGRILHKLEIGEDKVDNNGFPVRIENINVYKKACKHYNYTPIFGEEYYNEWVDFIAIKNATTLN